MSTERSPYLHSSGLEKVLEHKFIADLTTALWLDDCRDFEVLHSEVDAGGYDLVIEANDILRHIQLKSMVKGGKKQHITVNTRLATKRAGCVIWFDYDPDTLELGPFRWFGTLPGHGLPDPGDKVAKHSKADATGSKNLRSGHRILRKSRFSQVDTMSELVGMLFGYGDAREIEILRAAFPSGRGDEGPSWLDAVCNGEFDAVPDDLTWDASLEFAHLVDGYDIAAKLGLGDPLEFEGRQLEHALSHGSWTGGPAVLWATLFLEHRRWRTAPIDPDADMIQLLNKLSRQLVERLKATPGSTH